MIETSTETSIPLPTLTPLRAVREKCYDCSAGSWPDVASCEVRDCPLWPLRMGKRVSGVSPLRSIRRKCVDDCMCGSSVEVKRCHIGDCALHGYRLGKNPRRAGLGGGGNADRLAEWREKKRVESMSTAATTHDGANGPSEGVVA